MTSANRKAGDTRYLVEPNVKEGKGGLRDLHTLFWIAKYYYHISDPAELVKLGVLSREEWRMFQKSEDFLWARALPHAFPDRQAGRALSFEYPAGNCRQSRLSAASGLSAVERFMKHYFHVAKSVGDLTRIICATLEEKQAKAAPGLTA